MKTVPYQMCPICYGKGFVFCVGTTSKVIEECRICNGKGIITEYVIDEKLFSEKPKEALSQTIVDETLSIEEKAYTENPVMERQLNHSDLKTGRLFTVEDMEESFNQARTFVYLSTDNKIPIDFKFKDFNEYMNTK